MKQKLSQPLVLGFSLLLGACYAVAVAAMAESPQVAGYLEDAVLVKKDFAIKAKLDTGADRTSIHALDIEYYERDGDDWVRFTIENRDGDSARVERRVEHITKIKRHGAQSQERHVVQLSICVGGITREVGVSLVDRSRFEYKLLIGRNFLAGALLVDSAAHHLLPDAC